MLVNQQAMITALVWVIDPGFQEELGLLLYKGGKLEYIY